MPDATKTIAFRVSQAIDEQTHEMAKASGQSKSEWVRDQVMQALHAAVADPPADTKQSVDPAAGSAVMLAMEARLRDMEEQFRKEIQSIKSAVADAVKTLRGDLCTMAQVGLNVEESIEKRMETDWTDVLDAIERLKQSQRSHKDTVLRAIEQSRRTTPGRY